MNKKDYRWVAYFYESEGLAPAECKDGKCCHINEDYEPAYKERYDSVGGFFEGLATAQISEECFHIRKDGKPAYEERYDYVGDFHNGRAQARKGNKYFYIDTNGKRIGNKMLFAVASISFVSIAFILAIQLFAYRFTTVAKNEETVAEIDSLHTEPTHENDLAEVEYKASYQDGKISLQPALDYYLARNVDNVRDSALVQHIGFGEPAGLNSTTENLGIHGGYRNDTEKIANLEKKVAKLEKEIMLLKQKLAEQE